MSRDLKDVVQTAAGQRVALWLDILYDWKYCRKEKPSKDPLWQKGIEPALRLFARVKEIPETPSLLSKHCNEKCYHYREQKYEAKGKERKEMPLSHWDRGISSDIFPIIHDSRPEGKFRDKFSHPQKSTIHGYGT